MRFQQCILLVLLASPAIAFVPQVPQQGVLGQPLQLLNWRNEDGTGKGPPVERYKFDENEEMATQPGYQQYRKPQRGANAQEPQIFGEQKQASQNQQRYGAPKPPQNQGYVGESQGQQQQPPQSGYGGRHGGQQHRQQVNAQEPQLHQQGGRGGQQHRQQVYGGQQAQQQQQGGYTQQPQQLRQANAQEPQLHQQGGNEGQQHRQQVYGGQQPQQLQQGGYTQQPQQLRQANAQEPQLHQQGGRGGQQHRQQVYGGQQAQQQPYANSQQPQKYQQGRYGGRQQSGYEGQQAQQPRQGNYQQPPPLQSQQGVYSQQPRQQPEQRGPPQQYPPQQQEPQLYPQQQQGPDIRPQQQPYQQQGQSGFPQQQQQQGQFQPELAQVAGTYGEEFSYELNEARSPYDDTTELNRIRTLLKGTVLEETQLQLIYDAEKDGWDAKTFHSLVDHKGPAVVLGVHGEKRLVGGYNPRGWSSKGGSHSSVAAFLFYEQLSGELLKLCKVGGPDVACSMDDPDFGIYFGVEDLQIGFQNGQLQHASSKLGRCYEWGPAETESLFPTGTVELDSLRVYTGVNYRHENAQARQQLQSLPQHRDANTPPYVPRQQTNGAPFQRKRYVAPPPQQEYGALPPQQDYGIPPQQRYDKHQDTQWEN